MSDRDPNADWEQPRGDFSRGGAPHYSGSPHTAKDTPSQDTTIAEALKARRRALIAVIVFGLVAWAIVMAVLFLFD